MTYQHAMPQLGMGTYRLEDEVAYNAVRTALDVGYRHIDTAQIYGNEAPVGQAIADSGVARDALFVTTKVWNDKLTQADLLDSVRASLSALQLDYVDLLLVHWPAPANDTPMATYLNEMATAKAQGLTRHIGLSNFTIAQLQQAMKILPVKDIFTNQVEVHPYLINQRLRTFARQAGIHITGYMPFAVGKVMQDETLNAIAADLNVSVAEVVVAWALSHGIATIPSSTKRANLETNLRGAQLQLSQAEVARIDALDCNDRQATPDFAPNWDPSV